MKADAVGLSLLNPAVGGIVTGGDNTDGQATTAAGELVVVSRLYGFNSATWDRIRVLAQNADGRPTTERGIIVNSLGFRFNGSTLDREYNNVTLASIPSASRSATFSTATFSTFNLRAIVGIIVVSVNPGAAETLRLLLEGAFGGSSFTTLVAGSTTTFPSDAQQVVCLPGTDAAAEGSGNAAGDLPPWPTMRATVQHSAAGAWTYSGAIFGIS